MKIAIACDHGAVDLKNAIADHLRNQGHEVTNFGTHTTASCDYPDYVSKAAQAVVDGQCARGIVLCTTGIGASIAANKIHGIRCALLHDTWSAEMTRAHNDANMMALGAAVTGTMLALKIVDIWMDTPFSGEEKHVRRIRKVRELEEANQE